VVSQLKVNEIIKQSGSSITIGVDGDTLSGPFTNTPSFLASLSSNQTISNNTNTKIELDTVDYDTDSAFDNSTNYRFTVPSGKAGKYWLGAKLMFYNTATALNMAIIYIKKNGTQALYLREQAGSIWMQKGINVSGVLDLSVGDAITVDVYISHSSGTTTVFGSAANGESTFSGYKLII